MYKLRNRTTGFWIEDMNDGEIIITEFRHKALVFPDVKREFWEDDPDYEIVPLEVDELLSAMGEEVAPRFPGF